MSVEASYSGSHAQIRITGKFSFKDYQAFRRAYQDNPKGGDIQYTVDLDEVDYIDSAALGMLILLREHAGEEQSSIAIKGAKGVVLEALKMSHYDQLFRFE